MLPGAIIETVPPKPKHPGGRPTDYKPSYCQELIDFFDIPHYTTKEVITTGKNGFEKVEYVEVPNSLPHLIHFAKKIGVTYETIRAWGKKYPEFSASLKYVKRLNEAMLMDNALKGLYNPTFSIFTAKNKYGWRDEQHIKGSFTQNLVFKLAPGVTVPEGNRLRGVLA